jgi:hypothetical protein
MKHLKRDVLACLLGSALFASCGAPGVPIPPSLELAKPVTDLRAARKGGKVFLAWTVPAKTADRQAIRHPGDTLVCRSLNSPVDDCKNPITRIAASRFPLSRPVSSAKGPAAAKVEASYTDRLTEELQKKDPTAAITYVVSVENESGRSAGVSNAVQVLSAPTLPPPGDFRAQVKSDGVLLAWDCPHASPADFITYKLRIYRREQGKQPWTKVSDANVPDCSSNASPDFLDQTFEWERNYEYRATVVTAVAAPGKPEAEVEGDDTPSIAVFAHDIFPPVVPTGLQAVFSGVGQAPFVDLVWSPDIEADLAGYYVFRHEENQPPVKMTSEPVKTPAFRDSNVQSGKKYFYSVSAIDERSNESAKSEEASEQVP